MNSIYVHIPFCESKCYYCGFASFAGKDNEQKKYFAYLKEEINKCKFGQSISSIFIGGGTPSLVDVQYIEDVLFLIKKHFKIEKNAEITIEANPNSIDENKLLAYKKIGINRLSIGVQSLDNRQLKKIGRLHNKQQVLKALKLAKKVGFKNINCDLLLGLEKSSFFKIKKMIKLVKKYVSHFSCYMLQVEDGTLLQTMVENKQITLPNDDKVVEIYSKVIKFLSKLGFKQYEISNFAKDGYFCKHNLNYWSRGNYLGFGLGAHSFVNETRWANGNSFGDYYSGKKSLEEKLTKNQIVEEIIMLGLRCDLGIKEKELKKLNFNLEDNKNFKVFVDKKILHYQNGIIKIDPKYYGVSNLIIEDLIN